MSALRVRRILCPTDFSPLATAAVRYAAGLAGCSDPASQLLLLYADPFEPPPYFTSGEEEGMAASLDQHRRAAKAQLTAYARENAGKGAEALVAEAHPAAAILQTARERDADLIVMGTYGRSGVSRFLLGSVAERVLAEADRPVLTVRAPKEGRPKRTPPAVRRVLCPVNYTELAHRALIYAASLAACFGAELYAVHVVEAGEPAADAREETACLCAWVPEGVRSACSLKEIVRSGEAAAEIIDLAGTSGCDLIVLGGQHKTFSDTTVLGSTVVKVTRHAPCPVLTVFEA
ncbi:MAG: universal stress protein [Deltaproteobacteria bacterium]|nr:universal stress protein [Deltaproteobacteria bacterium]